MIYNKLTNKEYGNFMRLYGFAFRLRTIGSEDYLACRGCFLTGLFAQGFVLAEQAIEKELKSILLIIDPNEKLDKYKDHDLEKLIQKIQSYKDFGLTKFQKLAKRISQSYFWFRYPDKTYSTKMLNWSSNIDELQLIDEFYFYCDEINPIHIEFRVRSGIYSLLFSELNFHPKNWLYDSNKALIKRLDKMQELKDIGEKLYT